MHKILTNNVTWKQIFKKTWMGFIHGIINYQIKLCCGDVDVKWPWCWLFLASCQHFTALFLKMQKCRQLYVFLMSLCRQLHLWKSPLDFQKTHQVQTQNKFTQQIVGLGAQLSYKNPLCILHCIYPVNKVITWFREDWVTLLILTNFICSLCFVSLWQLMRFTSFHDFLL